ncbi:MAG TPA: kelch repeat-containing protein [bacterium]|nr:kelch repeat-containing protein [bacterium]
MTVAADKPFKTAWNTPTLVINQSAVSYTRSPWGRPTATPLKDGAENIIYTIPADDYYELGPNDFYEATDRLPAGTFTLDYGTAVGAPVRLKAWDKNGTELQMEHNAPNGDGSWPRMALQSYNAPDVSLTALDSSCRETTAVKIQNVNWIATMNKKVQSNLFTNPHTFSTVGYLQNSLNQDAPDLQESHFVPQQATERRGSPTWKKITSMAPSGVSDHAMAYDSVRGRIVLFGGEQEFISNETWEWDGTDWTQLNPVIKPSARYGHAMAYDSARGKVVLFGGNTGSSTYYDDTWEWDGANWIQKNPAAKPSARDSHAMVYDSIRGKVVLFGGSTVSGINDETWEWDGTDWIQINSATKPSERSSHAMVFDSVQGKTVLFGGYYGGYETWEWDGTNWAQLNPTTKPSVYGHAMAYDSIRGRVVLFGRSSGGAETWEWDGTNWIQFSPANKPTARSYAAMAYDSIRGKVILLGGYDSENICSQGSSDYCNDTWEWDGANWTQLSASIVANPSARSSHAMVYDSVRDKVILFGGNTGGDETWAWSGVNWILLDPVSKPSARYGHAMAYDSARGKLVLFGGRYYSDETWEWDGVNWTKMEPTTKPSGRDNHAMAYDSVRGKVVLFGGYTATTPWKNDETWEWDGVNWTQMDPVIKPSARYNHAMAYDSAREKTILFGGTTGQYDAYYNDETWEWDGTNWVQLNPATRPSPRNSHAMAYDSVHDKMILFGGSIGSSSYSNETWEWDGTNWGQLNPSTMPSPRDNHAMTYDGGRGKVVLYGGGNNETWEWNGFNWSKKEIDNQPPKPSARSGHSMAYDGSRRKIVLFGGHDYSQLCSGGVSPYCNDTWEWDGLNWYPLYSMNAPSFRYGQAMVYDSARRKIVLFGGEADHYGASNETWEWDGIQWTKRTGENCDDTNCYVCTSTTCPSGRSRHVMAYDMFREKTMLFGGINLSDNDETWEWDGVSWTQRITTTQPSKRNSHAIAYDPIQKIMVVFGGREELGSGGYSMSSDSSTWNGEVWDSNRGLPSPLYGHAMAYDSQRNKVILFGGDTIEDLTSNETWQMFYGTKLGYVTINWVQLNPPISPSARIRHSMVYHDARRTMLLFGGESGSYGNTNNEFWELNGGADGHPAQIMNVAWESSGVTDDSTVTYQSLSVLFNAGGLGDITGTPTNGVDLLTWKHDRWVTVASNTADPDNLAPVTWETSDPVEIQTLLNSGLRKFNFAVVPTAPNGFLTDMGKIATDYAEVIVRYSIP